MSPLADLSDAPLREDIRRLGDLLGQALVRQAGEETFAVVEQVRALVREDPQRAADLIDGLPLERATTLARAFSLYFALANVAEQVHRARAVAVERERSGGPLAQVATAIRDALESGALTAADVAEGFAAVAARPVFTAHPTEASRRSVLLKLTRIAALLDLPRTPATDRDIAEAIDLLWQTDELRLEQPQVSDEARNALFYLDDLAAGAASEVLGEFAEAGAAVGVAVDPSRRVLTFGSWIGGDRDGNPFVTPEATLGVLALQHDHAVRALLPHIEALSGQLSVSERIAPASRALRASLEATSRRCPTSTRASAD